MTAVDNEREFLAALEVEGLDLILSDYSIPGFNGLEALSARRARRPELPFIFVTGFSGEERAIETLRNGATDYVMKSHLARLTPAVHRPGRGPEARAPEPGGECALRQRNPVPRSLRRGRGGDRASRIRKRPFSRVNAKLCEITGYAEAELLGMRLEELTHRDNRAADRDAFARAARGVPDYRAETRFVRKDGAVIWVDIDAEFIRDEKRRPSGVVAVIRDITKRSAPTRRFWRRSRNGSAPSTASPISWPFWIISTASAARTGPWPIAWEGPPRSASASLGPK